ncbi:hypothetical protein [Bacillus chungangensis]|uniref:Head decoration protein n=1 Tax=Bacillus chungangensis TaxID=587633 RepID=A0ABT9WSW9_9BACI|nr:hypothetical protein [Bacillus chungangensis]MDQ0175997.1 hypothetical protein [Bacillus chungangensis]
MSKFLVTKYANKKEILKFPDHYVALTVTVDDKGVFPNKEGKKIVPAGTIVGGGVLEDQSKSVRKVTGAEAEGVLLNDVDVTYGSASGSMVIHGFIDLNKIPEVPDGETKTALKQITFLK